MINRALTPGEFADAYLIYNDPINTLDDLFDYMENHPDDNHWYWIDELDELNEHDIEDAYDVVLVSEPGNPREAYWFEIDATETW